MKTTKSNFYKYPTVSERDKDWQIYCTVAGFSHVPPNSPYPITPHPEAYQNVRQGRNLDEYQIIYITKGKGAYLNNETAQTIHPGSIIFLFPGVKHTYCPSKKEGWHEYYVGFNGPYAKMLHENHFINEAHPIYQVGLDDFIIRQFLNIFDFVQKEHPGFQQQIGASITQILAKASSLLLQQDQGWQERTLVEKIKYRFEESIFNDLDMEAFSKEFGMEYSKLRTTFKEITNHSPYKYFLQLKINKAKVLLQQEGVSVKEIAYQLAFQNEYYFSRLFKKKTGLSPTAWRSSSQFDNYDKDRSFRNLAIAK